MGVLAGLWAVPIRVVQQRIGLAAPPDRHDERVGDELACHPDIAPDSAGATGSVAGLEARIDLGANHLVVHGALARRVRQPSMEPEAGDIQPFAKPCHRPDAPGPRDEGEPRSPSLAN